MNGLDPGVACKENERGHDEKGERERVLRKLYFDYFITWGFQKVGQEGKVYY